MTPSHLLVPPCPALSLSLPRASPRVSVLAEPLTSACPLGTIPEALYFYWCHHSSTSSRPAQCLRPLLCPRNSLNVSPFQPAYVVPSKSSRRVRSPS